jgi:hypothetical protein
VKYDFNHSNSGRVGLANNTGGVLRGSGKTYPTGIEMNQIDLNFGFAVALRWQRLARRSFTQHQIYS